MQIAVRSFHSLLLVDRNNTRLTAVFQYNPAKPVPFWIVLELRIMEAMVVTTGAKPRAKRHSNHHRLLSTLTFLQTGCFSCRQTNSVRAPNGKVTEEYVIMIVYQYLDKGRGRQV